MPLTASAIRPEKTRDWSTRALLAMLARFCRKGIKSMAAG
jgi:hypothetical protein